MIRLYNVGKQYGEIRALQDVSMHVGKGEFVYVTGPSGAGKTTMLKMLYGAVRPSSGKLLVAGIDVNQLKRRDLYKLRRNMGIVFQDFKLIPRRTVFENVALALEVIGSPRNVIQRRVDAVLGIVGLRGRGDEYPPTLSGGEQ